MNPVGYLHNTTKGLLGERGLGYQYIMAANGLILQAETRQLKATIRLADATVRGLAPLEEGIDLPYGKIQVRMWDFFLRYFREALPQERLLTIAKIARYPGVYTVGVPEQEVTNAAVSYRPQRGRLVEVHSYGNMRAFFSGTDDADEQSFKIYGVVGMCEGQQEWKLRVGIYGYFAPLELDQVFA